MCGTPCARLPVPLSPPAAVVSPTQRAAYRPYSPSCRSSDSRSICCSSTTRQYSDSFRRSRSASSSRNILVCGGSHRSTRAVFFSGTASLTGNFFTLHAPFSKIYRPLGKKIYRLDAALFQPLRERLCGVHSGVKYPTVADVANRAVWDASGFFCLADRAERQGF